MVKRELENLDARGVLVCGKPFSALDQLQIVQHLKFHSSIFFVLIKCKPEQKN